MADNSELTEIEGIIDTLIAELNGEAKYDKAHGLVRNINNFDDGWKIKKAKEKLVALHSQQVERALLDVIKMVDQYVIRVSVDDVGGDPTEAVDKAVLQSNLIQSKLASTIKANIRDKLAALKRRK